MAYFDKYGVEFSDDRKTLIKCPKDFQGAYVVPNTVTFIGGWAFCNCLALTNVTIPESVTGIGIQAFWDCPVLSKIVVEKGNSVFDSRNNCNAIINTADNTLIVGCKKAIIPNSITAIGDMAFGYSGLTSVTIPNSVKSIGILAFRGCSGLTRVTIPNGVKRIEDLAFSGCSGLTSITISNNVTNIGDKVFEDCKKLKYVRIFRKGKIERILKKQLPDSVNLIIEESHSLSKEPRTCKCGCTNIPREAKFCPECGTKLS